MILNGLPRQSINSIGGLDYVLAAKFTDVKATEDSDGVVTFKKYDGETVLDKTEFVKYNVTKESSNIVETETGVPATGSSSVEQIATLIFHKADKEKRNDFKVMAHEEIILIAVDFNDNNTVLGISKGCDVITNVRTTGTVSGDLNGFTVTLRAVVKDFAPSVASIGEVYTEPKTVI